MKLSIRRYRTYNFEPSDLEFMVKYYAGSCPECYKPMKQRMLGKTKYLSCNCGCEIYWQQEDTDGRNT